jgi:hypothetical protein
MSRPDSNSWPCFSRTDARLLAGIVVWVALGSSAGADDRKTGPGAAPAAVGTRRALLVCGLPGDEQHRELFAATVEKLHKALTEKFGFPAAEVMVRFGVKSQPGDGPALVGARGLSDREGIAADVAEIRKRLRPEDTLWVIVLGHGHYDRRHSHLNLPGPDLDEQGFAKLFEGIQAREQVFFITTAASGFFLKPLAATGRIVVAATEPDLEVNETLFPHALADVLVALPEGTDRDKDGKVSVFELYLAVAADVMKRYADAENLPTEHARLDDNGDGRGHELQESYLAPESAGPGGQKPAPKLGPKDDGAMASRVYIDAPPTAKP